MKTTRSTEEGQLSYRTKKRGDPAHTLCPSLAPCWPVPPITLARISMVAQVSMSCMDTGVCPSALASRISTSCSAFSLNVSIRLTKELGKQQRSPWLATLSPALCPPASQTNPRMRLELEPEPSPEWTLCLCLSSERFHRSSANVIPPLRLQRDLTVLKFRGPLQS